MFRTDIVDILCKVHFIKVFGLESNKCKYVNKMETMENVTLKELVYMM